MKRIFNLSLSLIILGTILVGCAGSPSTPTATATVQQTPTATEEPMALKVNGEGITETEYQAELSRLQHSQSDLGTTASLQDQSKRVIDNFTDELLLEQAAVKGGFTLDEATLQSRIDTLATNMGGADKLTAWETQYGYTADTFKTALKREIFSDWERDQIINSVPETADQVHALQMLVQDQVNAEGLLSQLKAGKDFATLAATIDPTTGGDLGWFPQGYLTQPDVETAAFALQPGEYSDIIKSDLGYHIVYVVARDANHPLSVDARRTLQEKKLADWLQNAKTSAQIEVTNQ
jgi:Parvulin-like peptidyl-prolyl isomerase